MAAPFCGARVARVDTPAGRPSTDAWLVSQYFNKDQLMGIVVLRLAEVTLNSGIYILRVPTFLYPS